jgi:hypothetical protein
MSNKGFVGGMMTIGCQIVVREARRGDELGSYMALLTGPDTVLERIRYLPLANFWSD